MSGTDVAKLSLVERVRYGLTGGAPVVIVAHGDEDGPDAEIKRRKIQLYRPPTSLDAHGNAAPGISKELFGHYLVTVVERGTGLDLPHAEVDFGECHGRFASVSMTLPQWQQRVTFMLPIGPISQETKDAIDTYMAGVSLKLGSMHRGYQDLTDAHRLFDQAHKAFESLRNDRFPHYASEEEYMFCVAMCGRAKRIDFLESLPGSTPILDRTPGRA